METRTMTRWAGFPQPGLFHYDAANLPKAWDRLHAGDGEPLPRDSTLLQAWCEFHNGAFQAAWEAGLQAGRAGQTLANKAQAVYANGLEPREKTRLQMFMEVATRAEAQTHAEPDNPNAWYWHAYALGRYSQCISVAKALAQGLGTKVKESLEKTIALAPRHVHAHVALGAFHAEVIDKVGPLIGSMTYGAKKEVSLRMLQQATRLLPGAAIVQLEHARALLMLEGDARLDEANRLYAQAASTRPADAAEWLDVEMARAEMRD